MPRLSITREEWQDRMTSSIGRRRGQCNHLSSDSPIFRALIPSPLSLNSFLPRPLCSLMLHPRPSPSHPHPLPSLQPPDNYPCCPIIQQQVGDLLHLLQQRFCQLLQRRAQPNNLMHTQPTFPKPITYSVHCLNCIVPKPII